MNQIRCRQCGQSLPQKAKFCPECGAPVASSDRASPERSIRQASRQTGRRDFLIVAGALLIVTLGYFTFKEPEAVPERPVSEVLPQSDIPAGEMDEALHSLEDLPTDYNSLVALGNKYMDARNYPVAAECYQRALTLESDSLNIRVDYGACLHGMGLPLRALEEFRRVLDVNPAHAIANFNVGIVYYSLNEMDSARVYWQKYLTIEPDGRAAEVARALLKETGG